MIQAVYALWLARNETRDGKHIEEPRAVARRVVALTEEWKGVHQRTPPQPKQRTQARWLAPEAGWVKANCDGALSIQRARGGAGVVLRDHNGGFLAAACHSFKNVGRLHLELDDAAVVRAISSSERDLSTMGPVVQEIKNMLQEFTAVKVSWRCREANRAADKLAKVGLGDDLCKVWFSVPPEYILEFLSDDIPSFV